MTPLESAPEATGFHGDVSGLSLTDIIQLNATNAFSGCITAQQGDRVGRIFFREGRVIHAEQGAMVGEEAFCDLMEWRSGRFRLEPNIATTRQTIKKTTQFLLMEAHQIIDERRARRSSAPAAPPPAAAARAAPATLGAQLAAVPGVRYAVVAGKDGACDDPSFRGQALAGEAAYLAAAGSRLGAALGAGEPQSIVAHRDPEHLFVFASRGRHLAVLVDGGREVGAVEAELAKVLGGHHS